MNYTKNKKEHIDKVKTVFQEYIKNSSHIDLLWSDKIGYILITGISKNMDDFYMEPIVIKDAETLCRKIIFEICCDVLEAGGELHDIYRSSEAEKTAIREALMPYMSQLPEYDHLVEEFFIIPLDEENDEIN